RTIHRHRVTPGERTSLLTRQNQIFEETIARDTKGVHNEDCTCTDDTTQSNVTNNGADEVDAQKPHSTDEDSLQTTTAIETQASAISHGIPDRCPPTNLETTTDADASEAEDDYDEHVVFEDDEEDGEGYLFAGQG
ncbi:unnamed protein product, partial [Urochloa humidicola]